MDLKTFIKKSIVDITSGVVASNNTPNSSYMVRLQDSSEGYNIEFDIAVIVKETDNNSKDKNIGAQISVLSMGLKAGIKSDKDHSNENSTVTRIKFKVEAIKTR